jgi:putative transcriptional regulator
MTQGMQGALPRKLRLLRAERGLTLVEAAQRIGITRESLGLLEKGKRHPHAPTLAKLANGYGVPLEELLSLEEGDQQATAEEASAPLGEVPSTSGPAVKGEVAQKEWRTSISDLSVWASFINGLASDTEDWKYAEVGAYDDPASLSEQDFVLFAGRVAALVMTYQRVKEVVEGEPLGTLLNDGLQAGAQEAKHLASAYRRLSRAVLSVTTPEFEHRLNELADAEQAADQEARSRRGRLRAVQEDLGRGVA